MNENENNSIVHKINDSFKMPIYYNDDKIELKTNIITDLELVNTIDPSCNSIYSFCFNNDNDVSKTITKQISKYYTTDINFLKDNQKLIKEYKPLQKDKKYTEYSANYKNVINIWNELKIESGFKEKYYYIDWDILEFLNRSELFLFLKLLHKQTLLVNYLL
jgi:hypothetical protein